MPMEVDLSSYPKPQQPTNFLDTAQKYQQLESNKIGIDQSKLKLMNDRWGMINKELTTLLNDPDVQAGSPNAPQKVIERISYFSKLADLPTDMTKQILSSVPTDPSKIMPHLEDALHRGNENATAMNWYHGNNTTKNIGNQQVVGAESPRFGFRPQTTLQTEVPPTAQELNNKNEPKLVGPSNQPPVINQVQQPGQGRALSVGPINNPAILGPSSNFGGNVLGASVEPPKQIAQNREYRTGQAPGVAEAATVAGTASGKHLALEREASANYQQQVFPLKQAIPLLEKLGTKGTGPGTETINYIKSFLLSNAPGIKESDFDGTVGDYEKTIKYLTDYVNQNGNTGTNDKLAAAFAGNPSTKISNLAAGDVAKAALALRNMRQAQYLEWVKTHKTDEKFSAWIAENGNKLDSRAFAVNYLTPDAKKKLLAELNKNPKDRAKFENSLQIAHDNELITSSTK